MGKQIKRKVVVYAIQNNKLLVFRHVDFSYEEVGLQVPSGKVGKEVILSRAANLSSSGRFKNFLVRAISFKILQKHITITQ